jgi:hypothetical protein
MEVAGDRIDEAPLNDGKAASVASVDKEVLFIAG